MVGMFENLAAKSLYGLSYRGHHSKVFGGVVSCHVLCAVALLAKVLPQEALREALTVFSEHYRFRLRPCLDNPAFLAEKIHQIPVQRLPHASAIVESQRENGNRRLSQLVGIDVGRQMSRRHVLGPLSG